MTEDEIKQAMKKRKPVRFVAGGVLYEGRIMSQYGNTPSFLARGKRVGRESETINWLGNPSDFWPVRR